ncbi:MAG: hypothetical protein ACJ790_11115 [Myxococcaceae bacterium]
MRLPRAIRLASLLFAAAWTVAPVVQALHSDQHAHHYCEQHHAFEESSAKLAPAAPIATAAQLVQGEELSAPLHEGCACLAFSVRPALPNAPAVQLAFNARIAKGAVLSEAPEHRSLAVLDAAPKSSPPSA